MLRSLTLALAVCLSLNALAQAQLITQPTAARYGLTRAWYTQVPLDPSQGKVSGWRLHKDLLLVYTSTGMLSALDAETGGTRWVMRVGKVGAPQAAPAANDSYVAVASGTTLTVLDRATGRVDWEQRLPTTVGSGMVMSEDRVFLTLSNGWIASYVLENPKKGDWHYANKGTIDFSPIVTRQNVAWVNNLGLLNACAFDSSNLAFQFETDSPAVTGLSYVHPFIYMALKDDTLYAIASRRGRKLGQVAWRFYVGAAINHAPMGVGDVVYVTTESNGMYCLKAGILFDAEQPVARGKKKEPAEGEAPAPAAGADQSGGYALWQTPRASQFLAASPTRVYATDNAGRVMVLDGKSGAELGMFFAPQSTIRLANGFNDRIYLATPTGLIQCLHERDQAQPYIHLAPDEIKVEREIKKLDAPKEAGAEEKKEE